MRKSPNYLNKKSGKNRVFCFIVGSGTANTFAKCAGNRPVQPKSSHFCQPTH